MPRKTPLDASQDFPRNEGGPAWRNRGPCGYKGCTAQGLIAQWTLTGWANLCEHHVGVWHREHAGTVPRRTSDNAVMREIRAGMHKQP